MDVTILPATAADLPSILKIVNHSILFTTANYHYETQTLAQQKAWFNSKKEQNFPIFVAILDQKVIGFGSYGTFREKIGYQFTVEHSVYVMDEFIGKGIGKLLMQKLIQTANENNIHVMIGCIDADNESSIAFHEKFGFTIAGKFSQVAFKFDRWLNLVMMQLVLK
jgi:L-amino acid N-acyltransferase